MSKVILGAQYLFGLLFVVFGLNGFLRFISPPEMAPDAMTFLVALDETSYMLPFWKTVEILTGLCFLANRWVLPAAIIAMPVSINIAFFHVFLDPGNLLIGLIVLALNSLLLWHHRERLSPLFDA